MKTPIVIEVVNVKDYPRGSLDFVYIGRGTPYGNPFVMHSESDRGQVCADFAEYFVERIQSDQAFMDDIEVLEDRAIANGYLRLGCHCKPKECHGDTIAGYLRNLLEKRN